MTAVSTRVGGDSWVAVALRGLVAALAALAATWQVATLPGMVGAALGALAGVVAGEVIGRNRRARLTLALAVGLGVGLLAVIGWSLAVRWAAPAELLGTGPLLEAADVALLAGITLGVCTVLRAFGTRHRTFAFIEIAIFGAALATPLAAHRGGAINRPMALADYAWSQGQDPVVYLQLAGAVAAVSLALFLVAERRWVRALSTAILVILSVALLGALASVVRPPDVGPTNGLGLLGRGNEEGGGRRGAKSLDQLDFRNNYGSKGRNAPVAVVLLHDDYDPPAQAYYFRQNAFSRYNGRRMVPALDAGVDLDIFRVFPASKREARWTPPPDLRVKVRTTVALLRDHTNPVVLEAGVSVAPAKNPSPRRFRRAYNATSLAIGVPLIDLLGRSVGDPAWPPETRDLYLEAPRDPRYHELAERIVAGLPVELQDDPIAKTIAITAYLGRHGTYSLRSRHADAPDPVASFLFGDMTGYCVHFAHAAVYLLRAVGVPARLATGYQYPAKLRGGGSSLLLRGGDAHAWPEIFVDGVGWVVADVSPARNLEPPGAPLDPELQRMLGEMLRGALEEQRRATLEIGEAPPGVSDLIAFSKEVGFVLLILLALSFFGLHLGKLWRRVVIHLARPSHRTRLAYRLTLDRLSEVGLRRERGEPPEAFARRLADRVPSFGPLVSAASAQALGSRRTHSPASILVLARESHGQIRRIAPWWRRALGVIDPTTWLRVR